MLIYYWNKYDKLLWKRQVWNFFRIMNVIKRGNLGKWICKIVVVALYPLPTSHEGFCAKALKWKYSTKRIFHTHSRRNNNQSFVHAIFEFVKNKNKQFVKKFLFTFLRDQIYNNYVGTYRSLPPTSFMRSRYYVRQFFLRQLFWFSSTMQE